MDGPILQIVKRLGEGGGEPLYGSGGGENGAAGEADGRDRRLPAEGLVQLGRSVGVPVACGAALGSEQGGEIGVDKASQSAVILYSP